MSNERIFFKFIIDIPDIDKFESSTETSAGEHTGELLMDGFDVMIRLYYRPEERLDRKVMGRDPDYSYTLLSKFTVTSVDAQGGNLLHIDFTNYESLGMEASTRFNEFGLDFFTIQVSGVRLVYSAKDSQDSEIYLNKTAFKLVELNYKYHHSVPWKNSEFKWEPSNKLDELIKFNEIQFMPEHRFDASSPYASSVELKKRPRLRIKHSDLSEAAVKTHVDLLCDLYSFYSQKEVTWSESKIYAEGKLFYEVRKVTEKNVNVPHGLFVWDFIQNPLNLIRNVDGAFLFLNASLVGKMVERFNYALELKDEAKFMILYGLLEQLRNQYIQDHRIEKSAKGNPNRAKEEYSFLGKQKEVENAIEKALESLIPIVDPQQRDLFRSEIKNKIFGVRILSMSNQFRSYFDYLNINPEDYGLDFSELKSLRDKIFHGRKTDDFDGILTKANWHTHLPRFTGILLLKFFGIEDLKAIKKTRP